MFAGEHGDMASLNESDSTVTERRPWEFDLEGVRPGDPGPSGSYAEARAEAPATIEPVTEEVPVVTRHQEPAGVDAGVAPDDLTVASDRAFERVLGEPTAVAPIVMSSPGGTPSGTGNPSESHEGGTPDLPAAPTSPASGVPTGDAEAPVPARARPTGTSRLGRARRNGLRPGRRRAKRPEEGTAA